MGALGGELGEGFGVYPEIDEDDEDLKSLVSWGLPGYAHPMAKKTMGKKPAAGKTAKRATTAKTKGASKTK